MRAQNDVVPSIIPLQEKQANKRIETQLLILVWMISP
jgi:hypothetical protein